MEAIAELGVDLGLVTEVGLGRDGALARDVHGGGLAGLAGDLQLGIVELARLLLAPPWRR